MRDGFYGGFDGAGYWGGDFGSGGGSGLQRILLVCSSRWGRRGNWLLFDGWKIGRHRGQGNEGAALLDRRSGDVQEGSRGCFVGIEILHGDCNF
jgi:hypothetical protein